MLSEETFHFHIILFFSFSFSFTLFVPLLLLVLLNRRNFLFHLLYVHIIIIVTSAFTSFTIFQHLHMHMHMHIGTKLWNISGRWLLVWMPLVSTEIADGADGGGGVRNYFIHFSWRTICNSTHNEHHVSEVLRWCSVGEVLRREDGWYAMMWMA